MNTKKIVGMLRPYELKQQFFVYEDNFLTESVQIPMSNLYQGIMDLAKKYEITRIDFTGPKQYSKGLARKLKEFEASKYEEDNLEINIM
ncbi:MAG: hypothetical protein LUC37_01330 [Prevotella sp.]|nr:hypothetical protein [Prevotella sp.]